MVALTHILIEGFRGTNKPLEIRPQGSLVICGPTGSGKTTVLQAVEWGLYGRILGFTGSGFDSEDAYVNLFKGEGKASVTLDLALTDGTKFSIQRSRNRGKNSTVRQPSPTLTIGTSSFSGPEAQKQIESLIGLNHEKFCQSMFLHQETIRKFVAGSPDERSAIIDQLLGTAQIRGLAEALDPKLQISNQIKGLRAIKEKMEGEQTQIEVNSQDQLNKERDQLLSQGYKDTDLKVKYLEETVQEISNTMLQIAAGYSVTLPSVPTKIDKGEEAAKAIENLSVSVSELDRARLKRAADSKGEKSRIDGLVEQYRSATEQISQKPKSSKELDQQLAELKAQEARLLARRDALREETNNLESQAKEHQRLLNLIGEEEKKLRALEAKNGNLDALKNTSDENAHQVELSKGEIEKEGTLVKLLTYAHSYVKSTSPSSCPVCEQGIDAVAVTSRLEAESSARGAQFLKAQEQVERLEAENRRILPIISKIENVVSGLDSFRESARKQLEEIGKMIGRKAVSAEDVAAVADEKRGATRDIEGQIEKVKDDAWELNQEKEGTQRLDNTLRQLEKTLQKELSVQFIKQRLIETGEKRRKDLLSGLSSLEDTKPIDTLRQQLTLLKPVAQYVKKAEDFDKHGKGKSVFSQRIAKISQQIAKLEDLNASLSTLREIISEQHSVLTKKALDKFEGSIQQYYERLKGHPYFERIRIEPLATEPVSYDIKAFDDKGQVSTHINSRFSTGQIDVTALAVFLSVNEELAGNVPILILDDPTQNMDQPHQEALAMTLASVSKNRQLIVASHDEKFAEQILKNVKTGVEQLIMEDWTTDGSRPGTT